jgi:hypothetical protein
MPAVGAQYNTFRLNGPLRGEWIRMKRETEAAARQVIYFDFKSVGR